MSENKDSVANIKLAKKHKEDNKFAWDAGSIVIEYQNSNDKTKNYSPGQDRDKAGRFASGGVSAWKPSGTEKEAKEFAKDSSIKETLYHGTSTKGAAGIKKSGFDVSKKSKLGESNFPGTIMLTPNKSDAAWYAHRSGGSSDINGKVLSIKVSANKTASYTESKLDNEIKAYAEKHGIPIYKKQVRTSDALVRDNKKYLEAASGALKEIFDKHDAIKLDGDFGSVAYMIKEQKKVMVFGEENG